MKFHINMLVCALPLLGFPLGYLGKTAFSQTASDGQGAVAAGGGKGGAESSSAAGSKAEVVPRLVTGETLDSLMAQGEGVSYAALSLWLLDAEAGEMAVFWENFRKGNPGGDLKRLLFINWTRLDPLAAIDAVKGTEDETLVWWAWAAHDPVKAMAAANPEMQKRVAKGAGEFHPDWVRENFESIPEEARASAIEGITTWKEDEDHAATLDFLVKHGSFAGNIFKTFARKDPWGAYDWLLKNDRLKVSRYGGNWELSALIKEMKELHPDDLERMAAMAPSGSVKRLMEDAVFERLLAEDADKALEKAREGEAPLVNAKRLAMIGASLLPSDPEKAFGLGGEILSLTKGRLTIEVLVGYEGGATHWGSHDSGTGEFIAELLAKDPYRTLDMAGDAVSEKDWGGFQELSHTVAGNDMEGYAAWVNGLPESDKRARGSDVLVYQLSEKGHFEEASEWALSGYDAEGNFPNGMFYLLRQWSQQDGEKARNWLESSPVSDKHRKTLISIMQIDDP